jgi:hypothetical protein
MALWVTLAEADAYFTTRLNSSAWSALATDEPKTAALTTAQNDIVAANRYVFEDEDGVDLTTDDTTASQEMKDAVCEQALFLLNDPDMETRLSLQQQGVKAAGIVQETYGGGVNGVPLAPRVERILATAGYSLSDTNEVDWSN